MRSHFGHLLPLTEDEVEPIWNDVTLTVGANVLLDLGRYHPETRDALLHALRAIEGHSPVAETKLTGWRMHDVEVPSAEPVANTFAQLKLATVTHCTNELVEGPRVGPETQARLRKSIALNKASWVSIECEVEGLAFEQDARRTNQ